VTLFRSKPAGGAVWRGNEPVGFATISDRPMNALAEDAKWDTFNSGSMAIVSDLTAPQSPSNVCREVFPAGFAGDGNSNGSMGISWSPAVRRLYICYYFKYSANWQGHDSGINKHAYSWLNSADPTFIMEAEGSGSNPLIPRPIIQTSFGGSNNGAGNYEPNIAPAVRFIRGQWHLVEYLLVGNTAGNHDGGFDLWVDGVHTTDHTALFPVGFQLETGAALWNIQEIQPVWGGTSSVPVAADQYIQWDHFYMSGKVA
jgi:hypothetical protein